MTFGGKFRTVAAEATTLGTQRRFASWITRGAAAPKPASVFKGIARKGWEDMNRAIDNRGAEWMRQRFLRVRVGAWLALFVWLAPSIVLVGWGLKTFVQAPLTVIGEIRAERRAEKAKKKALRPAPALPPAGGNGGVQ